MATLKAYQVHQSLEMAEKTAFSFVKKEDRYNTKSERRRELTEKIGGLKPLWIVISFVVIIATIGLGVMEAYIGRNSIAGVFDPLGISTNVTRFMIFGGVMALLAMMSGAGLHQGVIGEIDEITGRRNREFGLQFILGLILSISIIGTQYYMVQVAGEGSDEFSNFAILAILFPFIEIIFGLVFLDKAMTYTTIFILAIILWFLSRGMAKTARKTNDSYRDYRVRRDAWNVENPTQLMELEGNENIRRAIAYYAGIKRDDNNGGAGGGAGVPLPINNANNATQPTNNPDTNDSSNQAGESMTEDEVQEFLNNDDDNITF